MTGQERKTMNEEQRQLARKLMGKALKALQSSSVQLSARDIKDFIRMSTQIERTSVRDAGWQDSIENGRYTKEMHRNNSETKEG